MITLGLPLTCFTERSNLPPYAFIVFVHYFLCKGCKIHVRREKNYKPTCLVVTYNSRLHDVTSANQLFPLSVTLLTPKVT